MRRALAELGYLSSAPKTALVRGIFENSGLLLAEMLDDPRFSPETLTPPEFAELMSWFVADGRKPSRGAPGRLSPRLRQARQLLEDATARVQRAERNSGMLLTHPVVPVYTNLVCRCCAGEDVARLSREYLISEGDIAVQCDRARQLLRQVARVTQDLAGYAGLASLAGEALQCLAPGTSSDGEEELPA
jgi:superfamily II RNA helicase